MGGAKQAVIVLTPQARLERIAQLALRQGVQLSTLQQKSGGELERLLKWQA